ISSVTIIPTAKVFIGTTDFNNSIYLAPGNQFAPFVGQLLVDYEFVGTGAGDLEHVWYDGSQLQRQSLGNTTKSIWEEVGFIPGSFEPGLPNWTIYLDLNNNGLLDTGEPFTKTDANGNYSFLNIGPGTYYVREVPQTGWNQTAPTPIPPGKYTVTVSYGTVVTGLDFGNQPGAPPPDTPPTFTSTAITTAQVGQKYQYNAVAVDNDTDTWNFDLPVYPKGMA